MSLYDQIGRGFDSTRNADSGVVRRLAELVGFDADGLYLDLGCGTGNYALALADRGFRICGVDLSEMMIRKANQKDGAPHWVRGDAQALPFEQRAFSGVICVSAVHHFPALAPVFEEVRRVMADGNLVIFTSTPEQMKHYWLNEYFPNMLGGAMAREPSAKHIVRMLQKAGFKDVRLDPFWINRDFQDRFLYSGKYNPSIYLDDVVRANISLFAARSNPDEVQAGCQRLSADIASGEISNVMYRYDDSGGDLMFIIAGE